MEQAIGAYQRISVSPAFRELERMRSIARHDEASALGEAEERGREEERGVWQGVVAEKDAALASKDAENERLRAQIAELLQAKAGK